MSPLSPDRIVKLGYAYREAKALLSAIELGVFTALADGPLALDELRNKIGINLQGARDFFDALVALGLLNRNEAGRYANTAETARYLDRGKPTYLGGELEFINAQLYARWNDLTAALTTGNPQSGAGSGGSYPDRYRNPASLESFAKAMTAATLPSPWRSRRRSHGVNTRRSSTSGRHRAACLSRSSGCTGTLPAAASTCRR